MEVRPCRVSSPADLGDDISPFDRRLFRDHILLVMGIDGKKFIFVLDNNEVPIPLHFIIAVHHSAAVRCPDEGAYRRRDIDTIVPPFFIRTEPGRYRPFNRPDKPPLFISDCGRSLSRGNIFYIDIHLEDLGGTGDEDSLSHLYLALVLDPVDPGHLVHIHSIGLADPPQGLMALYGMIDAALSPDDTPRMPTSKGNGKKYNE